MAPARGSSPVASRKDRDEDKYIGAGVGGAVGGVLGALLGGPIGAAIGGGVGSWVGHEIRKWLDEDR